MEVARQEGRLLFEGALSEPFSEWGRGGGRRAVPVCACAGASGDPASTDAHARCAWSRGGRRYCACAQKSPLRSGAGGRRADGP